MCYYSRTLCRDQYRDAKAEGEDLVIKAEYDVDGHHFATSPEDGKVVCILPGTKVHFKKLELNPEFCARWRWEMREHHLKPEKFEGKPFDGVFVERPCGGYSADRIVLTDGVDDFEMHLVYIKAGTKFYTGEKRADLSKLGVDDPSIALDHSTDKVPAGWDKVEV